MFNCQLSGRLPNLIIIGAMKSGTTSLHHYLDLHPEIQMSRQKELNFFVEDRNWYRGIAWYKSHFMGGTKIRGESSPLYSNYPVWQGVPQRMHSLIPNAKLIYLVRDPVERIVSQYTHFYAERCEHRPLSAVLSSLSNNFYVNRSRYFHQLSRFLKFFSKSQILVVTSESLARSPKKTMRDIFQFLEVDPDFEFKFRPNSLSRLLTFGPSILKPNAHYSMKMHRSIWKRRLRVPTSHWTIAAINRAVNQLPSEVACHARKLAYWPFSERIKRLVVDDELRSRLLDYLSSDIQRLQDYTGYDFAEWNIPACQRLASKKAA